MNGSSHAVVIGGSIAGLLAARVLTRHFDRVTIFDRDTLPAGPTPRRGAPQANHNHVLLLRGRQIMEDLFPGLQQAIIADGGLLMDMAADLAWLTPQGWGARFESPLLMLAASRALLEWRLRQILLEDRRVTIGDGSAVEGLVVDNVKNGMAGGRRVRGVRTGDGKQHADLVVDASGRGSRAPQWLLDAGFHPPRETVVNAFLGYASRIYRPAPDPERWWKGVYLQAAPPASPHVGVILPIENGLWHVTLGGGDRQYPPVDDEGFLAFARNLRNPLLYEALRAAEPCSPIHSTRSTENRRRHYEDISLPDGFVVTGDAACGFNPVYGQGMTTAAIGAMTLDRCLARTARRTGGPAGDGLPARFQKALARTHDIPWALAIGEDLRYRRTEGARAGIATRLMHAYVDRLGRAATFDPAARLALLRVFHLVASPASILAPRVVLRALRSAPAGLRFGGGDQSRGRREAASGGVVAC